ncbi:hypothetical protein [Paraburkholderia rhizosphaerae]|uniref:Uncharacterized protein n=1 Tax=Paraburkholderia rhizosphaerae TaxID=480658 RepID=A0A4R8LPF7_9BURK|nr:hypothetical protein [Paraburkholderia rhizosphaerae]TDY47720.1 hypothetical protein BX592_112108 [Paraburkholderia rhizosphaerae]
MQSIPFDALDRIGVQLMFLNAMLFVYLVCKGVAFVTQVVMRRDPPRKSIRSKLAQSDES